MLQRATSRLDATSVEDLEAYRRRQNSLITHFNSLTKFGGVDHLHATRRRVVRSDDGEILHMRGVAHVLLCATSTWNPCNVYTLRKRTLGLDVRADRRGVHAGVTSVDGTHASSSTVVTGTWHAVICASRPTDSLGGTFSLAGEIAGSVGRGTSVAPSAAFSAGEFVLRVFEA